jgi:hypothetical protein
MVYDFASFVMHSGEPEWVRTVVQDVTADHVSYLTSLFWHIGQLFFYMIAQAFFVWFMLWILDPPS